MKTLEELLNYCESYKDEDPIGALMLTGEWGSGKTYFIDKCFRESLDASKFILVRVSLMGKSSVYEVRSAINISWLQAVAETKIKAKENILDFAKKIIPIGNIAVEIAPEKIKDLFSPNVVGMLPIQKKCGSRTSILVLDDFERTKMETIELMGCINDYCENLHIPTIVIANEEKLNKVYNTEKSADISAFNYQVIKEKLVQRTIIFEPDYCEVVGAFIDNIEKTNAEYSSFLRSHKNNLAELFCGDAMRSKRAKDEKHPEYATHNLRSLRYALQEYARIYKALCKFSPPEEFQRSSLFSFVSYTLAYRASANYDRNEYDPFKFGTSVGRIYAPFYDDNAIFPATEEWICSGRWDESKFCEQLLQSGCIQVESNEEQLEYVYILNLEEDFIRDYFPSFLEKAYGGMLTISAYIVLLADLTYARRIGYHLANVDYDKLKSGIASALDSLGADIEDYNSVCCFLRDTAYLYQSRILSIHTRPFHRCQSQ